MNFRYINHYFILNNYNVLIINFNFYRTILKNKVSNNKYFLNLKFYPPYYNSKYIFREESFNLFFTIYLVFFAVSYVLCSSNTLSIFALKPLTVFASPAWAGNAFQLLVILFEKKVIVRAIQNLLHLFSFFFCIKRHRHRTKFKNFSSIIFFVRSIWVIPEIL